MRKRRVLALLIALSLVVSGNGMTTSAAEQGTDMPVLTSQEAPASEDHQQEVQTEGKTEDLTANQGKMEEEKPAEGDSSIEEKPAEGDGSIEEKPVEGDSFIEEEKPAEGDNSTGEEEPAEGEDPDEADSSEPKGEDGIEELPGGDEAADSGEQVPAVSKEEAVAEKSEEKQEETSVEKTAEARVYTSRIVTFVDDTGMQVRFDANAEQQYNYVVDENGVLTKVTEKSEDVSGNTIESPVKFSGNVELKQPEEGKQYTSIASGVFGQNTDVTYVKLPEGVETIETEAFKGCTSLKGIYLPAGLKKIGNSAFEGCTALSQIAMPKTVTQIGDSAFKGDARLHLVYMKDVDYCDLQSIGAHAFEGCSVLAEFCSDSEFLLPSKLESIGEAAFKGCKTIAKVNLANTKVTTMGASAFMECMGLTELWPGKTLPLIPEHAFDGCRALTAIHFENGQQMTIDRWAFANCYNLKQLELPQTVSEVRDYAFQGCTKLTRVQINCYLIKLGEKAFPVGEAPGMVISADPGSEGYKYAVLNGCQPDEDTYYKYTVEDTAGSQVAGGEFPGGTIWVTNDPSGKNNINDLNQKQGVKSGTACYIFYKAKEHYTFIADSLRYNGQVPRRENGIYTFTMPEGGVVITAQFQADTPENIKGTKVTVEFSAGTPLRNGMMDEYGYLGVRLKVGQTTRMFLLDEDGQAIPAAKIHDISSSDEKVATVTKGGVITAVGTGGREGATTTIQVTVRGQDGQDIVINRDVSVVIADAYAITLKASTAADDAFKVEFSGEPDGRQFADIKKGFVSDKELKISLKANVYDDTEDISKNLTWKTSNDKVAVLSSGTTEGQDSTNEITVKKGCEGEATITVTAKNAAGAEKEEVTQKFVIRVYEAGFRLGSSTVTLNPNLETGCTIDLISTYSKELDGATIRLYQENNTGTTSFNVTYDEAASSSNCKKFVVKSNAPEITDGQYKVKVQVNNEAVKDRWLPLTINVSRNAPTPTIKFNTKNTKFNLFYKDGRSSAGGEPTVVTTEITKLGSAKIEKVSLEALTKNADDRLFEENFVIDETGTDLTAGRVVIKRSDKNLRYTSQKKPAVTGYLAIYYKGYEDSAAKKMKVTMPTCTTAPSYALREAKGTYSSYAGKQNAVFELYDKKSKTKERVVLGAEDTVTVDQSQTDITLAEGPVIRSDGTIGLSFIPYKGKLKLVLKNESWDLDKDGKAQELNYIYTLNVSSAKPAIKANLNTITLNLNYPERDAVFELVSNPKGVQIDPEQTFKPVYTRNNGSEIDKLVVSYKDGKGVVAYSDEVKSGQIPMVKAGTYKFECEFPQTNWPEELKKVTLTVKVVDKKPTIKLGKGALQLNLFAYDGGQESSEEQERAEVSFSVSEKPEGYTLAQAGKGEKETEITCTNNTGAESHFNFHVSEENSDNILRVSLKDKNLNAGTYRFRMTARYLNGKLTPVSTKPVNFSVKVYNNRDISLTVTAKGKINLVNREGEANDKNGIVYTPKLKNLTGKITDVKIYDVRSGEESVYFDIEMIKEGKDAGKFFVSPKITLKAVDIPKPPVTPEKPPVSDDTTKPDDPSMSDNTTKPDDPSVSDNTTKPGDPSMSDNTTKPGDPSVSDNTTKPGDPSVSDNTTKPGDPSVSDNTTKPGDPSVSDNTTTPEKPTVSDNTTTPERPTVSDNTTTPGKPDTPIPPTDSDNTPAEGTAEYEYAQLVNNIEYSVMIWVKVEGYAGAPNANKGVFTNPIKIKTAQTLPKVTTDKSLLDVYLSSKDYDASFIVRPKEGSVGKIEEVYFAESDKDFVESFKLKSVPQADGSLKVIVHLQEAVSFANDTTNDVKMYVKFKGQGTNTPKTATSFTIKIRVN